MTQAQQLLVAGIADLHGQLPATFTIEGIAGEFRGATDGVRISNDLGPGGFAMEANAILHVRRPEFESFGIEPRIGMRIVLYGQVLMVTDVDIQPYGWNLSLMVAHPKETSPSPLPFIP